MFLKELLKQNEQKLVKYNEEIVRQRIRSACAS